MWEALIQADLYQLFITNVDPLELANILADKLTKADLVSVFVVSKLGLLRSNSLV